jgi:protein-L-isoaspartate(D-aspartate) O-methyltransferase
MQDKNDKFREMRENLVIDLYKKGIKNKSVLTAIRDVPRELFVPYDILDKSYDDSALPIDCGQTISQPYTVAYMSELLDPRVGDKILEIGTGSGYQSAIIAKMGAKVFSVERIRYLYENAKRLFEKLDIVINLRYGDGSLGWREESPFDSAIITAAAPEIPKSIIYQLKIGGKLIVPIGSQDSQWMYIVTRTGESRYDYKKLNKFRFVPLIGKEGWN